MVGRLLAFVLLATTAAKATAQSSFWVERQLPYYPPIARAAHVGGGVHVSMNVSGDGKVRDVVAQDGPLMLHSAAAEFVSNWRLKPGVLSAGVHVVLIRFELVEPADDQDTDNTNALQVEAKSPEMTVIRAPSSSRGFSRSGCPVGSERLPPMGVRATDFVETGWPRLRVKASGEVDWDPPGAFDAPDWSKATKAKIEPEKARQLIERFRVGSFWGMCRRYEVIGCDFGSADLTASLGGIERNVYEYGEDAPAVFEQLRQAVHEATNSHQWRVGDPKKERMGDIGSDVWLPKPGRTDLMALAYHGDKEKVEVALLAGADVNAADDSGWTPLMYAAGSYGSSAVSVLLTNGAKVDAAGLQGETALLFAALRGDVDGELLKAGADPNAKTHKGVTALMLLAQSGDAVELKKLLLAGARADARDAEGYTAMDYLLAASCGRDLTPKDTHPSMIVGDGTCNRFQDDDLPKAMKVLREAGALTTHHWFASGEIAPSETQ